MAKILNITPEQYHADPMGPSLSASIAKIIEAQSEAHAWLAHPHFGNQEPDPSKAKDRGTLIHRLMLGKGVDVVEIHEKDYRKNVAKEQRDAARAEGKLPMLSRELAELSEAADVLRMKFADAGFVFNGQSEVPVMWEDRLFLDSVTVRAKAMFDHLPVPGRAIVWDIKTITSCDEETISKAVYNNGYDIQRAAYTSALLDLYPDQAGREEFWFLFCEVEPPYAIAPRQLDAHYREIGERRWERAKKKWHRCLTTGKWPAYQATGSLVGPPGYVLSKEMERGYAAE